MKLAVITSEELATLIAPDRVLVEALRGHGINGTAAVWSDATVDWASFDGALIRTPWDYYKRPQEFAAWLTRIEALALPMWNAIATVRWNMHKGYLDQLAKAGAPLPGTQYVVKGTVSQSLAAMLEVHGWDSAVVKPAISGGAWETFHVSRDDAQVNEARYRELNAAADTIVQEYCPAIATSGELSLIYVAGVFSHAVRKVPRAEDFRVQESFGGTNERYRPSRADTDVAEKVLAIAKTLGHDPLYARVDMVEHRGSLCLMELELIEPSLFVDTVPEAVPIMAAAMAPVLANAQANR